MNKSEEQALKLFPPKLRFEMDGLVKIDDNEDKRCAYIKGYEQAEQNLELTWEDIKNIYKIQYNVECDYHSNTYRINNDCKHSEKVFKEVLRRFKEIKNK